MSAKLERLQAALRAALGDKLRSVVVDCGQVIVEVEAADYVPAAMILRDDKTLEFAQLIDLCGVDYSDWGGGGWSGARFAVTSQLLSVTHNWRVRLRSFCADDDLPIIDSLIPVWNGANWFEREAFDLYGIVFTNHPDLRRLLTDYGFVGHPFRKDFPVSGNVEMRYDPEQKRVVYQPVTIEPREIVPRVIREETYASGGKS
jgi:NADH-quinone oxidoreductase subunit C